MTNVAYLLLGSNEGDRKVHIEESLERLYAKGDITAISSIYGTAAWGLEEQPDFLNMAVRYETVLTAMELLALIQDIEEQQKRQRSVKWGQRTLDIDILFYNDDVITLPELNIPHPFLAQRRFVLVPMCDIAPTLLHPVFHITMEDLLTNCTDPLPVSKFPG